MTGLVGEICLQGWFLQPISFWLADGHLLAGLFLYVQASLVSPPLIRTTVILIRAPP